MFCLRRPDTRSIERFLYESTGLPLSYGPVGLARLPLPGYDLDETEMVIGSGSEHYRRACAALRSWTQFNLGWVELFPRHAFVEAGTVVAVLVKHLGFWSLSGCRVVYALDRGEARYGFAYGTLTNHVESGEEFFEVSFDQNSGAVTYRIRAMSRPRAALARLGYPIARVLQARFRRDSAAAMARALRRPSVNDYGSRRGA